MGAKSSVVPVYGSFGPRLQLSEAFSSRWSRVGDIARATEGYCILLLLTREDAGCDDED